MIEEIAIVPNVRIPWEVMDDDATWKMTYNVRTQGELTQLLKEFGFELHIRYRSGDVHLVDALAGVYLKLRGSRKLKELQLLARVAGSVQDRP